jgi:hypothetical protein
MAEAAFRGIVPVGQTRVSVTCNMNKIGLRWVVWQISVECSVVNSQAQVDSVRRNGRYITSSLTVPSSAQGPPALSLEGSDELVVVFSGLSPGNEAVVVLFYEEVRAGELGSAFGLV